MKYFITLFYLGVLVVNQAQVIISPYFTPVNVKVRNLDENRLKLGHERIRVNYSKKITQEFGVDIEKVSSKKLNFGLGLSLKNYDFSYTLVAESNFNHEIVTRDRTIKMSAIGFRLLSSYKLTPETKVSFVLEINKPYKKESSVEHDNNYSIFKAKMFSNEEVVDKSEIVIREHESSDMLKAYNYIVPEINFQTKIYKNLALYYGMKLKLWNIYDLYSVNAWGYYSVNDESAPLFESKISTKQFSFNFGFIYSFHLKGKK